MKKGAFNRWKCLEISCVNKQKEIIFYNLDIVQIKTLSLQRFL